MKICKKTTRIIEDRFFISWECECHGVRSQMKKQPEKDISPEHQKVIQAAREARKSGGMKIRTISLLKQGGYSLYEAKKLYEKFAGPQKLWRKHPTLNGGIKG